MALINIGNDNSESDSDKTPDFTPIIILKKVTQFIGWLTGSVAGITAILYACGYLIILYHIQVLGLYNIIPYDNMAYIHQGAKFFISSVTILADDLLIIILITVVVTIIYGVLILTQRGSGWIVKTKTQINCAMNFLLCHHSPRKNGMFMIVFSVLLFALLMFKIAFVAHMDISGMLIETCQVRKCIKTGPKTDSFIDECLKLRSPEKNIQIRGLVETRNHVVNCILNNDVDALTDKYRHLLELCLLSGFIAIVVNKVITANKFNRAFVMPFMIIFLFYALLLPVNFGILMRQIDYPSIAKLVSTKGDISGIFHLLGKSDQELMFWDASSCAVLRLPQKEVQEMYISKHVPLLTADKNQKP